MGGRPLSQSISDPKYFQGGKKEKYIFVMFAAAEEDSQMPESRLSSVSRVSNTFPNPSQIKEDKIVLYGLGRLLELVQSLVFIKTN